MAYYSNGAFADDPWRGRDRLHADEWRAQRAAGTLSPTFALALEPGFDVEAEDVDVAGAALIEIAFPKFTDGRGYSMGWLLRRRLGYRGELRAVGDVLFDQLQLMVRCGFDAFEIVDPATLRLLQGGRSIATFDRFYQPGLEPEVPVGTRPWARRTA